MHISLTRQEVENILKLAISKDLDIAEHELKAVRFSGLDSDGEEDYFLLSAVEIMLCDCCV